MRREAEEEARLKELLSALYETAGVMRKLQSSVLGYLEAIRQRQK